MSSGSAHVGRPGLSAVVGGDCSRQPREVGRTVGDHHHSSAGSQQALSFGQCQCWRMQVGKHPQHEHRVETGVWEWEGVRVGAGKLVNQFPPPDMAAPFQLTQQPTPSPPMSSTREFGGTGTESSSGANGHARPQRRESRVSRSARGTVTLAGTPPVHSRRSGSASPSAPLPPRGRISLLT